MGEEQSTSWNLGVVMDAKLKQLSKSQGQRNSSRENFAGTSFSMAGQAVWGFILRLIRSEKLISAIKVPLPVIF